MVFSIIIQYNIGRINRVKVNVCFVSAMMIGWMMDDYGTVCVFHHVSCVQCSFGLTCVWYAKCMS
jgi:hypothetical protein